MFSPHPWPHDPPPPRAVALVVAVPIQPASAQWAALHPGGGGQVQDVTLDPTHQGTVYVLSDVDGVYRSTDYGERFESLNEGLHTEAAATIEVDPSDSQRLFLGTARGVLRSTNGGQTWQPMADTEKAFGGNPNKTGLVERTGLHVSTIEIDPVDPDRVYFANSWNYKHTYGFYWGQLGFNTTSDIIHPGEVYVTDDGGDTWSVVEFESTAAFMDVYSIEVNPVSHNEVYLSAHSGLYKSEDYGQSWDKLPTPAGAFYGHGAAITPDGAYLVAAYTIEALPAYFGDKTAIQDTTNNKTNPNSSVFTTPVLSGLAVDWQRRDQGLPLLEASQGSLGKAVEYWRPKVDPRSTAAGGYDVILGTMEGRQGLYRATFAPDATGNLTDAPWTRILWKEGDGFAYDQGWDDPSILSRYYAFTPPTWGDARIWATTGQSFFEGNPSAVGWPTSAASWRARYTERRGSLGGLDLYATRGVQSSVNYDQAALGRYVIQAQADNGSIESFDGGQTWTDEHQPPPVPGENPNSNARAVHVFDGVSPAVTLLASGPGYGSGEGWTPLHALVSDTPSPSTAWNARIDASAELSATKPKQDYVSSIVEALPEAGRTTQGVYLAYLGYKGFRGGIYYHPDVTELAQGRGAFETIRPPSDSLKNTYKLMAHPSDPAVLYRLTGSDLFRMVRGASGEWVTTKLTGARRAGGANDFTVWAYGGRCYVAYGNSLGLRLSDDGGDTFRTVWEVPDGSTFGPWYDWLYTQKRLELFGFVARGPDVFFGLGMNKNRKGAGFYRATLDATGPGASVTVEDWSGSGDGFMPNPRISGSAEIITIEGVDYVALPTRGSGLWVRPAPGAVASDPTLRPTDDAYTRGGAFRNDTYGTADVLELSQGSGGVNKRNAFVKFDLSGVQTPVASATLRLYGSLSESTSGGVVTQVFSSTSDAWSEATLTWQTSPGFGSNLAEFTVDGTDDQWYEVDVTDFVNGESDGTASFLLRSITAFPGRTVFSSKEGDRAPELVVSSSPAAAPARLAAATADQVTVSAPFPNPATTRATLRLGVPHDTRVTARVYDVLGRVVVTVPEQSLTGEATLALDLAGLSAGTYLVRVTVGDDAFVERVTVAR